MQPPAAPTQPSNMDVDNDASQPTEPKSSSTTKKSKGKAKASEVFIHHQEVQVVEESLAQVLQCVEEARLDPELVRLAINSDAMQTLIENLLTCLDVLRNELRQSERARMRDEDEKMRLWDEILHLKNDDRQRDDLSQYTTDDEEHYRKKRKEQKSDRLPYDNRDERDTRRTSSQPSEDIYGTCKRSIQSLPSQSSSRQPSQHVLQQESSSRRGRETPPPQLSSSSQRSRETPSPQSRLSVPRDREIHLPQPKPSMEESRTTTLLHRHHASRRRNRKCWRLPSAYRNPTLPLL